MTSEKKYATDKFYDLTATIANGATTSEALDLNGLELAGLFLPSNLTATSISLTASTAIDGTYVAVQDGFGSTYSLAGAASKYVPVNNFNVIAGLRFIKLVAGSTQTPTDAIITLSLRGI